MLNPKLISYICCFFCNVSLLHFLHAKEPRTHTDGIEISVVDVV